MKLIKEVKLCPACDECPQVEIYEDEVRIGEEGNVVRLTKEGWNELVEKIKGGELQPL